MPDRTIDLDLWEEGNAEKLPAITVTDRGKRGRVRQADLGPGRLDETKPVIRGECSELRLHGAGFLPPSFPGPIMTMD